jgi:hypothetical protein
MRSCSSAVFMEETAEPIAAADLTLLALADDVQTGGWIRRLQPERPVRTMTVVVVDIDPKHTLQVPWPTISSQSRHSARAVPIHRSAKAFALGACTGVTCSAGCCLSTNELHERIYAPHGEWSGRAGWCASRD